MKLRLFFSAIAGLAIVVGTTTTPNQPSYAEGTTFFCGTSNDGVPVTYARTPRGNVPMIRWVSTNSFPPQWSSQRRCQEVSQRFQRNSDNGTLQALKTGTINGQPAVCAAISEDEPCTDRNLLFTLKPGSDARRTVERLLDTRGLAAGTVVEQSACQNNCPIYINMSTYLDNATVEGKTSHQ